MIPIKQLLLFLTVNAILFGSVFSSCQTPSTQAAEGSEEAEPPAEGEEFVSIFDGDSLNGWEGAPDYWRVENGTIVGEITPEKPLPANSFLIWQGGEPKDFELKAEFRISESGNSGINYRSEQLDTIPFALRGYQADIDGQNRYTGQNYEERKRTTLAYRGQKTIVNSPDNPNAVGGLRAHVERNAWVPTEVVASLGESDSLKTHIKQEDWNEIHLVIKGNRLQHYVNGVLMSDVTDEDQQNRAMGGLLGLQVHRGPPMKVEYRDIQLKEL
ncbi:MAG: DUF1080 domain-containing protein [Cyclobacteriaceae bacterium]